MPPWPSASPWAGLRSHSPACRFGRGCCPPAPARPGSPACRRPWQAPPAGRVQAYRQPSSSSTCSLLHSGRGSWSRTRRCFAAGASVSPSALLCPGSACLEQDRASRKTVEACRKYWEWAVRGGSPSSSTSSVSPSEHWGGRVVSFRLFGGLCKTQDAVRLLLQLHGWGCCCAAGVLYVDPTQGKWHMLASAPGMSRQLATLVMLPCSCTCVLESGLLECERTELCPTVGCSMVRSRARHGKCHIGSESVFHRCQHTVCCPAQHIHAPQWSLVHDSLGSQPQMPYRKGKGKKKWKGSGITPRHWW